MIGLMIYIVVRAVEVEEVWKVEFMVWGVEWKFRREEQKKLE